MSRSKTIAQEEFFLSLKHSYLQRGSIEKESLTGTKYNCGEDVDIYKKTCLMNPSLIRKNRFNKKNIKNYCGVGGKYRIPVKSTM